MRVEICAKVVRIIFYNILYYIPVFAMEVLTLLCLFKIVVFDVVPLYPAVSVALIVTIVTIMVRTVHLEKDEDNFKLGLLPTREGNDRWCSL